MRSFEGKNEEVEILKIEYHHLHKKPRFVHPINPQLKDHTIIINAAVKNLPSHPKLPQDGGGCDDCSHSSFGEGVFLLSPSTWKLLLFTSFCKTGNYQSCCSTHWCSRHHSGTVIFFSFFYLNLSIVSTDELFLCKTF